MKMQLVSVKDNAVEAFMQPSFVHHVGLAIRSFTGAVRDENHEFNKHASDFDLYHLGEFNDEDGLFYPLPNGPERIARGLDLKIPTLN